MRVLITDPVDGQCIEILRSEGFDVEHHPGISSTELKELIRQADALVVRSETKVTSEIISAGEKLKVIGRAGAGIDNIDVSAATRRGIIVMNTPGGNTVSTAEHTVALMLTLARNVPQADQSLKEGKWERKKFVGTELYGKTLGIIGLGKVGAEVARRCLGFGMTIIAFDPVLSSEAASKIGAKLVDLDEIFRCSDFISVHTPLTPDTKNLIRTETIAKCKGGVRIINCARGGIVNEKDILTALETGKVAGAAFDVFEVEPPSALALINHPRFVATPHLGASTEEAQEKVAIQIAHQVADVLKERGISGAVNADTLQATSRRGLRPYLILAEKIGSLIAQIHDGELRKLTITLNGSIVGEIRVLGAAVLKGLLERVLTEPVNYINALVIARERGIDVQVHREDEPDDSVYSNLLTIASRSTRESRTIAGTVFGENDVRIVKLDGFPFEFKPEGQYLLFSNIDRPGMLASVSAILAKAQINIAGLSLGRYDVGQQALTVVAIDSSIPFPILEEIASINGVFDVKLISWQE